MKMPQNDTFRNYLITKTIDSLSCCVIHYLSEKFYVIVPEGKYFKAIITIFTLFISVFRQNAPKIGGPKVQREGSISRIDQYAWKYTSAKFNAFNKKCTIWPKMVP